MAIPHLLVIMDGWGQAPPEYPVERNAIALARKPFYDALALKWPRALLKTSGFDVGLPAGVMGNSEVGHLNIGAGRVVWQDLARIDRTIEADGLMSVAAIVGAIERARDSGAALHLMGLCSGGSVHSVDRHYFAILRLAARLGMPPARMFIHCFVDGRDTPPQSGLKYIGELEALLRAENLGRIASITGRYYAMDRDKRWERVQKAYDAVVAGVGRPSPDALQAIRESYAQDPRGDEFVPATVIVDAAGKPIGAMRDGDEAIFFNFRADRARQLSHALLDPAFEGFPRAVWPRVRLTSMTVYESNLPTDVAFGPKEILNPLGEVVADAGKTQLRMAETEKYAHVTYFINGGREAPFPGEERILVPSPKVATYDQQPEMSAPEVTRRLEESIRSGRFDLLICNFANCDMVGHTGVLNAAIQSAEAVDAALSRIVPAILDMGGAAILTADHGNAEQTWNYKDNCPDTQHTTNPVPLLLIGDKYKNAKLRQDGRLADLAPTFLTLMGLNVPAEMDGQCLLM